MTLRTDGDAPQVVASVDGLHRWVLRLPDPPVVLSATRQIACADARHSEPSTWLYVIADPRHGVACWRCVACSRTGWLADSADRWTHPTMWACGGCQQSLAELVLGTGGERADASVCWSVLAARCPDCGTVQGLTDVRYDAPSAAALLR